MKITDIWKAGLGTFVGGIVSFTTNIAIYFLNHDIHSSMTAAGFNVSTFLWVGGTAGTLVGGVFAARSIESPQAEPVGSKLLSNINPTEDAAISLMADIANAQTSDSASDLGFQRERLLRLQAHQLMLDEVRLSHSIVIEDVKAASRIAELDPEGPSVTQLVEYFRSRRLASADRHPDSVSYPIGKEENALTDVCGPQDPAPVSSLSQEDHPEEGRSEAMRITSKI